MNKQNPLTRLTVGIKGAGEIASAIAWRLYMANIRQIFMMEVVHPLAVRRRVSFCESIHDGEQTVEEVSAMRVDRTDGDRTDKINKAWSSGKIAVLEDPEWKTVKKYRPDVIIDAILAKKNIGTQMTEAPLVIGLGPGFTAGKDVHRVIETNRGHNLGRIITSGQAAPNTGIPGVMGGYTTQRVLRAPVRGVFEAHTTIGDTVKKGNVAGTVAGVSVQTEIDGVVRGLIRSGSTVKKGLKVGDIDPRGKQVYGHTISEKARAIGGSVLEVILSVYNR